MDVGWHAEAKKELDRLVRDFPASRPEGAGRERAAVHPPGRGRGAAVRDRRAAARRSSISAWRSCSRHSTKKGSPTELQIEVREIERHDEQQHAADKALAAELRKLADRLPSAARGFWKEAVVEVLKAIDEAPDAVRDRFAAWRKAKSEPGDDRPGPLRPGDVGLRRGPRAWPRRARRRPRCSGRPATGPRLPDRHRAGGIAASRSPRSTSCLAWPSPPARRDASAGSSCLTRIIQLMPPPRHDERAETSSKTMLHRVAGGRGQRAHRVRRAAAARISSAAQLPGGGRPAFRARARRRDRRVGRRGRSPGLYPDRARVQRAGPAATTIATPPASTPPSSWPCATPASATRSTATASSSPASSSAATWPGTTPWPIPTCLPAWSSSRACPPSTCRDTCPHHERLPLFYVIGDLAPAANEFIYAKLRQAADRQDLGHHLRRVLPPRPGDASRGDHPGLRLDGPPPPRPLSQVVQGRTRPGPPTTGSTASWSASSPPAAPPRRRPPRCSART